MPVVLFLCTHNAGRSLAAKVLLDHYAAGRVEVRSAGSDPGSDLNPSVVALLEERGLDASREFPKTLTESDASESDLIVTMGCGDSCPVYPGKHYVDWDIDDPEGLPIERVRPIIEEIDKRVQGVLRDLDLTPEGPPDGAARSSTATTPSLSGETSMPR
jgi:arsenate reductase (thioredoxin)